jgi:hypothetical protein
MLSSSCHDVQLQVKLLEGRQLQVQLLEGRLHRHDVHFKGQEASSMFY